MIFLCKMFSHFIFFTLLYKFPIHFWMVELYCSWSSVWKHSIICAQSVDCFWFYRTLCHVHTICWLLLVQWNTYYKHTIFKLFLVPWNTMTCIQSFDCFWFRGSCYTFCSNWSMSYGCCGRIWMPSAVLKILWSQMIIYCDLVISQWHEVNQESAPVHTTYDFHFIFSSGLLSFSWKFL